MTSFNFNRRIFLAASIAIIALFVGNTLPASANFMYYDAGAGRITFSNATEVPGNAYFSGNVGVGTASPSYKLDVQGGGARFAGGIVYFDNSESINLYGIRGRFTNEYIHMYNKVGIGNPGGWGTSESVTPVYGLSTYGGANFATNQGNVGIGTASPGYKLDVQGGNFNVSGNIYRGGSLIHDGGTLYANRSNTTGGGIWISDDGGFYDPNNAWIQFSGTYGIDMNSKRLTNVSQLDVTGSGSSFTNPVSVGAPTSASHATTKNYVDSVVAAATSSQWVTTGSNLYNANSGNVGIGTASPGYKLDVTGTAHITGAVTLDTDLTVPYGGTGVSTLTGVLKGNGASAFSAMNGTANYAARWTDANTIGTGVLYDNGTNVGIGTASPGYKLHVVGSAWNNVAKIESSGGSSGVDLFDSGVRRGVLYSDASGFGLLGSPTAWVLRIPYGTNNAVFENGNVGIGTASAGQRLSVNGITDMMTYRIINLGTPTGGTDAATKDYVDTALIGSGGLGVKGTPTTGVKTVRNSWGTGLYNYYSYSDTNAPPSQLGAAVGFGSGTSGSGEIWQEWVSPWRMYHRALRDCCENWSGWIRTLDTNSDPYPANMNQYVRTSDNVTFNNLSLNGTVPTIQGYSPANGAIRMTPNLHLNSMAGNAVILNWDNGTTGTSQTLRIGNGASSDVFWVRANGETYAAGNVGIGATSPGYKLDVQGTVGFTTAIYGNGKAVAETGDTYLRINQNNQFSNGVWLGSSNLMLYTNHLYVGSTGGMGNVDIYGNGDAVNRITINGSTNANSWFNTGGNVGIGTASPGQKLAVNGIADMMTYRIINLGTPTGGADATTKDYVDTAIGSGSSNATAGTLSSQDIRTIAPSNVSASRLKFGFTSFANNNSAPYADFLHFRSYVDASGGNDNLAMFRKDAIGMRLWQQSYGSATAYSSYRDVITTDTGAVGSSGYLSRWTGGTTHGNSVLYDNGTNIGIGTTGPGAKLDIGGGGVLLNGTAGRNYFKDSELSTGTGLRVGAAWGMYGIYAESGAGVIGGAGGASIQNNSMFVTTGGNVGIGTTGPGYKLDVQGGDISVNPGYRYAAHYSAGNENYLGAFGYNYLHLGENGNNWIIAGRTAAGGHIGFVVNNTTNYRNYSDTLDGTIAMYITSGGNVGIGTTSPGQKLSVNGAVDMINNRIINVAAPVSDSDAATKSYVNSTVNTGVSGTAGYIPKFTSANTIGNTAAIYENGTNVGIGTTGPTQKLDVVGNMNISGTIQNGGYSFLESLPSSNGDIYANIRVIRSKSSIADGMYINYGGTGGIARIYDGGTTNFVAVASGGNLQVNGTGNSYFNGNVGIGTASPGAKLDVALGGTYNTPVIRAIDGSHNMGFGVDSASTYWGGKVFVDGTAMANFENGGLLVGTSYVNQNAPSNGLLVEGSVGIGTTAPGYKLDVAGNMRVASGDNSFVYYGPNATWGGQLYVGATTNKSTTNSAQVISTDGNLHLDNGTSKTTYLNYYTAGNIIMNSAGGNVGIGTASPGQKLSVNGAIDMINNRIINVATPIDNNDVATKAYVGSISATNAYSCNADGTCEANAIALPGISTANITGVNKMTVKTIDPLYEIGGVKYATFAASIAGGVKEEYSGQGVLTCAGKQTECEKNREYEYAIAFSRLEKGSDLWVWYHAVDFEKNNVEAVATPYGQAAGIYYVVDSAGGEDRIVFKGDKPAEFSYRLTGRRFDWKLWPTKTADQKETPSFIIK